jgi:hypothetical protein
VYEEGEEDVFLVGIDHDGAENDCRSGYSLKK